MKVYFIVAVALRSYTPMLSASTRVVPAARSLISTSIVKLSGEPSAATVTIPPLVAPIMSSCVPAAGAVAVPVSPPTMA